jgi:hypothetical protein
VHAPKVPVTVQETYQPSLQTLLTASVLGLWPLVLSSSLCPSNSSHLRCVCFLPWDFSVSTGAWDTSQHHVNYAEICVWWWGTEWGVGAGKYFPPLNFFQKESPDAQLLLRDGPASWDIKQWPAQQAHSLIHTFSASQILFLWDQSSFYNIVAQNLLPQALSPEEPDLRLSAPPGKVKFCSINSDLRRQKTRHGGECL